jgi:hypothetical protein
LGAPVCYGLFSKDCAIGEMDLDGCGEDESDAFLTEEGTLAKITSASPSVRRRCLGEGLYQVWASFPERLLTRRAGRGPADPRK